MSKNNLSKDLISGGPAVNHIIKAHVPVNISEKSINNDVEVASNGSHTAADKGKSNKKCTIIVNLNLYLLLRLF